MAEQLYVAQVWWIRDPWSTQTRPVSARKAAEFMGLMLETAGVPEEKLSKAYDLLVEGRELAGRNGRKFRVVPYERAA